MPAPLFERHCVIDIDTHVTEPPDVFSSRIASRWRDAEKALAGIDDALVSKVLNDNAAALYGIA